jgi:hypothetical protein
MVRHLADCRFCYEQVAAAISLKSDAGPAVEVPRELLVRARALAESAQRRQGVPALRWGAIAAVTASIAVIVAVTSRQPEFQQTLPQVEPSGPAAVEPAPAEPPSAPPAARTLRSIPRGGVAPRLIFPREGEVINPQAVEFRWKPVPGALSYDIRVVTEEGNLVWEGQAEDAHADLPPDFRLTPGESYFVRIRALLADGQAVTSRAVGFKVKGDT